MSDPVPHPPELVEQPAWFRYFFMLWRRRWIVVTSYALTLGIVATWTAITPNIYEATATLVAPREAGNSLLNGFAIASGLLQQLPNFAASSLTPNRDLLMSVLRSRTLAELLIDRFDLQRRYRERYRQDTIRTLYQRTGISVSREGVISVRVQDNDPEVAARMANFYVDQLDRFVAQYGVGEARHQRAFLSEQLARARAALDAVEESLRRFQERNRAIVLQEQTRGAIEAAARLKGEIIAAQVQLQVVRNFATDANPEVVALRRRIDEMNRQLAQMQYGESVMPQTDRQSEQRDFTVPFARVPGVGLELARLTRDMKIQETLVTLLTQQVEQARINEARDLPIVQVLDRAVPAERPSRPRVTVNLIVGSVAGILAGVLFAFCSEYFKIASRRVRASDS